MKDVLRDTYPPRDLSLHNPAVAIEVNVQERAIEAIGADPTPAAQRIGPRLGVLQPIAEPIDPAWFTERRLALSEQFSYPCRRRSRWQMANSIPSQRSSGIAIRSCSYLRVEWLAVEWVFAPTHHQNGNDECPQPLLASSHHLRALQWQNVRTRRPEVYSKFGIWKSRLASRVGWNERFGPD